MSAIIEIENLTHRFADGTVGLDRVTVEIEAGAFVVIAGANGSGKTTLLRHLNGLLRPTSGSVRVAGISVQENPMQSRVLVGMVFQDADSQIVGETVRDDVAFGPENLRLDRAEIDRRVGEALSVTGLTPLADKRPHLLSGGEKRRLAIAGILAMRPRVVVCDEPFANLDYPGVRQVLDQILRLHRAGGTIIVTTHDLEKVLAHANRLIFMRGGRIEGDGPPPALVARAESFGVRHPRAVQHLGVEALSWLS
ncbi:MAG: energy-coupling factor ABC transporter ATP-binding protein [Desulfobacterales bacterium]|jgi:biotin transport system ATP-binding protein|nr:energy-coupling factor ABC transporter ATP-binding protein [Desulfobacterales bacterium]